MKRVKRRRRIKKGGKVKGKVKGKRYGPYRRKPATKKCGNCTHNYYGRCVKLGCPITSTLTKWCKRYRRRR